MERVREEAAGRKVVCGVSGGVDSSVLAALLHEAGVDTRNIFVDTGLLRKDEAAEVEAQFKTVGIEIETIDASERFLTALADETDPEEKRRIIGRLSKGYRQRVGIADAILAEPDLIIMDEPTIGLDPHQIVMIRNARPAVAEGSEPTPVTWTL